MCIAVLQLPGATKLPMNKFMDYGRRNPDGFGLLYINDGKLDQYKTLGLNDFYNHYQSVFDKFNKYSTILVHFRLGTQGKKDLNNCHPFLVNDEVGFIHNGIIRTQWEWDKEYPDNSDTFIFNEKILKPIGSDVMYNQTAIELVSDYIGAGNKIPMISTRGDYIIYGQNNGEWDKSKTTWLSFKESTYSQYDYYKNRYGNRNKPVMKLTPCTHCKTNTYKYVTMSNSETYEEFDLCEKCVGDYNILKEYLWKTSI